MKDGEPTIEQQVREIEGLYLSREAQLRQRHAALAAGKTVPPDICCIESSLPTLEAALRTLRWVQANRDRLRALHTGEMA